jgi:hypothetical protein
VITLNLTAGSDNGDNVTNISLVSTINSSDIIVPSYWYFSNFNSNGWPINCTFPFLKAGSYQMVINSTKGFYKCNDIVNVVYPGSVTPINDVSSFAGGYYGINATGLSPSSYLIINGMRGNLVNVIGDNTYYYQIPELMASEIESRFNWTKKTGLVDSGLFSLFSDTITQSSQVGNVFDLNKKTYYVSSNAQCWIGMDMGAGVTVKVNRFKYLPNMIWRNNSKILQGATFEGSNDMNSWSTLATIDQTVKRGWNVIVTTLRADFRFIRFKHNSTSQCSLAELKAFGVLKSNKTINLTSFLAPVTYIDSFNQVLLPYTIEYREDKTGTIDAILPPYGDIFGGYNITLVGTNLNFSNNVYITIDGVSCTYMESNTTSIICQVGAKSPTSTENSFEIEIGGMMPFIRQRFTYVLKWSDIRTWGTDLPPVDGDLVYVPPNQTLLVDQDTPQLAGIAVQNGTIIFPNDTSITVKTDFITLVGGNFIAGTEEHHLNSNLTIILSGDYYDPQQPMAGNKAIFCLECKFSMYGKPRPKTWTTLNFTITPGTNSFMVNDAVDWKAGEQIVVASTGFDHEEAETATISGVYGTYIVTREKFNFTHLAVVETHGTDKVIIRAEVGLLSRNIKIMGEPTSTLERKYGAHLRLYGTNDNGF